MSLEGKSIAKHDKVVYRRSISPPRFEVAVEMFLERFRRITGMGTCLHRGNTTASDTGNYVNRRQKIDVRLTCQGHGTGVDHCNEVSYVVPTVSVWTAAMVYPFIHGIGTSISSWYGVRLPTPRGLRIFLDSNHG